MNKLLTPIFRVSFPQVFEARAIQPGQTAKYSLTMLFTLEKMKADKEDWKLWNAIVQSVKTTAAEKWPKGLPQNFKNPFRDGVEKEQYGGYGKGVVFIVGTTTSKPGLVDQKLQKIISPDDFYAGCYARATINAYPWSKVGKNGVSFGLQNIQKTGDGEPFSGRTNPDEDFDAVQTSDFDSAEAVDSDDPSKTLFG